MKRLPALTTCLAAVLLTAAAVSAEAPPRLWVYAPVNFQVDASTDDLITLLKRAKAAGYNAAVVTDYKFGRIAGRPQHYYTNLKRTQQAADDLGVELIPAVFPIGYSNELLQNDPNLAEGIAVKDCLFVAHNGKATVAGGDDILAMGDFETMRGDKAPGWDFVDGPGRSTFRDAQQRHSGDAALRMEQFTKGNEYGNCRLSKQLTVRPWHQYHLSLWVRTRSLAPAGDFKAAVLTPDGQSLNFANLGVKPTQDWTEHHAVFNSMANTKVRLYVGVWGGRSGQIWLDDLSLRPVAGVNLLRRDGCPLKVTSEDGATEYVEGRDFEPWDSSRTGRDPYAGEFKVYHPTQPIVLTADTRIAEGQKLKVSYYHTATIYDGQVSCCLSHEDVYKYLADEVAQLRRYLHPKTWFMSHDELRLAGQCALCKRPGVTAGQLLAENARRCVAIIRNADPDAGVYVWSDMFDPHHNAVDHYYLVGSTLAGSWEGLDASVGVMNWNGGKRQASMAFFAGGGHKQIVAGYYDNPDVEGQVDAWLKAADGLSGIEGFMYTTWRRDYRQLERFANAVKARYKARP